MGGRGVDSSLNVIRNVCSQRDRPLKQGWTIDDNDDDGGDASKENVNQQLLQESSLLTSPATSPEKQRNVRNLHEMTV